MHDKKRWSKAIIIYSAFLLIPIYWLVVLSMQPEAVTKSTMSLLPAPATLNNYLFILFNDDWAWGYINAIAYVTLNMTITLLAALPAAYAFSRFRFVGGDQAMFLVLIFRLIPPAVMMIPLVQMFSAVNMIDTYWAVALAHCLFTLPIAIWILEGFISGIPVELEEAAAADGYSRLSYFIKILMPQIKTGIGVAAFFCFIFSWVELLMAHALTTIDTKPIGVIMRMVASPLGGVHIGITSAASILMLIPGMILAWALRKHLARGFSLGRVS